MQKKLGMGAYLSVAMGRMNLRSLLFFITKVPGAPVV